MSSKPNKPLPSLGKTPAKECYFDEDEEFDDVVASPSSSGTPEPLVVGATEPAPVKKDAWKKVKKVTTTPVTNDPPVAAPKLADVVQAAHTQHKIDKKKRVPIDETIVKLKTKVEKKRLYKELIIYLVFLSLFLATVFMGRRVGEAHFIEAGLRDAIIDEEFLAMDTPTVKGTNIKKTFNDINSFDEFYQWIQGPFLSALTVSTYYNDEPLEPEKRGNVYFYNHLVGGLRIRQLRVMNDSCHIASQYASIPGINECLFFYDEDTKDTLPFGPHNVSRGAPDKYQYSTAEETGAVVLYGKITDSYEAGGYVVDVHQDELETKLQELKEDMFFNERTRAVVINFNMLNVHLSNHVAVATFLFEISPGGKWELTSRFALVRLATYVTSWDYFRLGIEAVVVLFWLYYIVKFIRDARRIKKRDNSYWPFINRWNLVEFSNLAILGAVFYLHVAYYMENRTEKDFDTKEYIGLEKVANFYIQIYNVNSFNVFLMVIKVFKFLRLNMRMSLLWRTLDHALFDLIGFFTLFFVVLLAFTLMGHILFGPEARSFDTVGRALQAMIEMILGSLDYEALKNINRVLAPVFFLLFVILVYFSLLNVFLAILNDSYEKVHEKVRESTKYTLGELIRKRVSDFKAWTHRTEKKKKPKISDDEIIRRLYAVSKDKSDLSREDLLDVLKDEVAVDIVFGTQEKLQRKKTGRDINDDDLEMQMLAESQLIASPMSTSSSQLSLTAEPVDQTMNAVQYQNLLTEVTELKAMIRALHNK